MTTTTLETIEVETAPNPGAAIIWMHGLGADGNDFVPMVPELDLRGLAPIRFIFPHAQVRPVTINNGYEMRAWYDVYGGEFGSGPSGALREDSAGLHASQLQIEALIAKENARGIPTDHIVLAGFSQGCAMVLQTGLRHKDKLAGMMCLSGYLPLQAATETERQPANQTTPIFMAHGTADPVVAFPRATQSRDKLQSMGYNVEWHEYRMQHSLCQQEVADIGAWLHRVFAK